MQSVSQILLLLSARFPRRLEPPPKLFQNVMPTVNDNPGAFRHGANLA